MAASPRHPTLAADFSVDSMAIKVPNPRRSPPREVGLLDGRKRRKVSHTPESRFQSSLLAAPTTLKGQKSQASGSDESASGWFNKVSKHVTANTRNASEVDDEPPFFVGNQTNHPINNFEAWETDKVFGTTSRIDSENEDLRGVIDDLTVENKKLKYLVRVAHRQRRTPVSDAGQQDKLFEVRMHGLPSDKRRELEQLLKTFATSFHTSTPTLSHSTSYGSGTSSSGQVAGKISTGRADSGYVSNSGSGQTSGTHSQGGPLLAPVSQTNKANNVRNYLHDIPDILLPKKSPVMSERAKMALVVRRLEQLFTGKIAAPGEHSQPLQQQEVSHSAARADSVQDTINNKKKTVEGSREAHIMPSDAKDSLDSLEYPEPAQMLSLNAKLRSDLAYSSGSENCSLSHSTSPDQRPTRPLDLDIHRAQIATENIEYIRHLGLSSPHINQPAQEKDSSWMYLNLLTSMAQLHTINVTPDFVRQSIKKMSEKFELSKDGHRVRWLGGPGGTQFSKEEEKCLEVVTQSLEFDDDSGPGSSKRSNTNSTSNRLTSTAPSEDKDSGIPTTIGSKPRIASVRSNDQSPKQHHTSLSSSAFDYKPIVYREASRAAILEESYLQDTDSSGDSLSRGSGDLTTRLSRSIFNNNTGEEGMMTFYNSPYFCSDFSGDSVPTNTRSARPAIMGETVGIPVHIDHGESALRYHDACYFAQQFAPRPYCARAGEVEPTINSLELETISHAGEDETIPVELEACGLGGVYPEDNFAVDVKIAMVRNQADAHNMPVRRVPLTNTEVYPQIMYQVEESRTLHLLPSKLPPPSYIFFTSSSSSNVPGDEESSDGSDVTSSAADEDEPAPPNFLMHWSADSSGDQADVDDDDDRTSSMDMLATARKQDPTWIAQQERQYLLEQAPAGVVAGSLAATVGTSRSAPSDVDQNGSVSEAEADADAESTNSMDVDA